MRILGRKTVILRKRGEWEVKWRCKSFNFGGERGRRNLEGKREERGEIGRKEGKRRGDREERREEWGEIGRKEEHRGDVAMSLRQLMPRWSTQEHIAAENGNGFHLRLAEESHTASWWILYAIYTYFFIRQQFSRVMWVNRIERVMQDKDRKFKFIYNLEDLEVVYENDLSSHGQD